MKSTNLIVVIVLALFFSCNSDDDIGHNNCAVDNPVEDLDWLKAKIAELEASDSSTAKYRYISQAEYNNRTVFILGNCCPICNTVLPVYDCEGASLGIIGTRDQDIDESIMDDDIIIWSPSDFTCTAD